ncbi:MAG TPA: hypothetical protein VMV56_12375 [Williamwhitmania sp.]|nr:hypothetical protein [Williamwhitmania sp.]
MDLETRKKARVILVIFIILLIPLIFFTKWMIGVQINNRVEDRIYRSPIGFTDATVIKSGINDLERAKFYAKRNYLIYYNQARLYCLLKDYPRAIGVIEQYESINKHQQKLDYLKGLIYDILDKRDSAIHCYSLAFGTYHKPNSLNDSLSFVMPMFLIYGKDSAYEYLPKRAGSELDNMNVKIYRGVIDSVSYKDFALENVQ